MVKSFRKRLSASAKHCLEMECRHRGIQMIPRFVAWEMVGCALHSRGRSMVEEQMSSLVMKLTERITRMQLDRLVEEHDGITSGVHYTRLVQQW